MKKAGQPAFPCPRDLVMAMAEQNGTVEIFGFDDTFSKQGYFLPAGKVRAA